MSVPIPSYLRQIAVPLKMNDAISLFSVKCTCGCEYFQVYTNCLSKQEVALKKAYFDAEDAFFSDGLFENFTKDRRGRFHYWRFLEPEKGWNGKLEEVVLPEYPFFLDIRVVKAKCAACGEEHLIFDSRIHGYDSVAAQKITDRDMAYKPHFRRKGKEPVKINVMLSNEPTLEKFQKTKKKLRDFTEEQYSNSFDTLYISKSDENGKYRSFFSWLSHHKN